MATLVNSKKRFYMCPQCFQVKEFETHLTIDIDDNSNMKIYANPDNNITMYCSKCIDNLGDYINMVEIDKLMVPVIVELNRKGWYTDFCCEGHIGPSYLGDTFQDALDNETIDDSFPYISFDFDRIVYHIKAFAKETFNIDYVVFENLINHMIKDCKRVDDKSPYIVDVPYHWYSEGKYVYDKDPMNYYNIDNKIMIRYDMGDINFPNLDLNGNMYMMKHDEYVKNAYKIKEAIDQKEIYMTDLLQWAKSISDLTKIKTFKDFRDLFHE